MKFVGTHDPRYLIAVEGAVEAGQTGPEPGDLQDDFCAIEGHEVEIAGHLVVEPDIIGHGDIDMTLQLGAVPDPVPGLGIEMQGLGFLPA
ncbi:MAG: hypothetical protein ACD_75C01237G0001, partial [uncultured bacterium]